jgi:hypothetical protein
MYGFLSVVRGKYPSFSVNSVSKKNKAGVTPVSFALQW